MMKRVSRPAILGCLLLAGVPAWAQEVPAPEALASYWMEICVRDEPAGGDFDTGDFKVTERDGEVVRLAHPDGAEMTLTAREGFFACEIVVQRAPEGYRDAILAVVSPALQQRYDAVQEEAVETGMVWEAISAAGLTVEAQVAQSEDGVLRLTAATGTETGDPAPSDNAGTDSNDSVPNANE